ncbi:MAG TPA: phosphoenolpyruvate-utilizing N-terminal domain-containing protein, partial [Pyrinomonadaceae bacterium]|nr:phosphoenolpyruvate-utilizing N-terminal domain-containing protein [Pyrinomonadaceae bacterium]
MSSRARKGRGEERLRGVAVSEGAARGRVLRVHGGARRPIFKVALEEREVERETRRFRAAVRLARRQLLVVKRRAERA